MRLLLSLFCKQSFTKISCSVVFSTFSAGTEMIFLKQNWNLQPADRAGLLLLQSKMQNRMAADAWQRAETGSGGDGSL